MVRLHTPTIVNNQRSFPYLVVSSVQIFAAQRYSLVINADQPVDNYWIRAQPNAQAGGATGFDNGINSAILRYVGAPVEEPPTRNQTAGVALVETDLHPLTDPAAPGEPFAGGANYTLNLNLGFAPPKTFMINGTSFVSPSVPVLLQILSGKQLAQDLLPKGSVFTLPRNQVIEININGGNAPGGPVSLMTLWR